MAKHIIKNPKYKSGDVLKFTNPISKMKVIVILDSRYDNNKTNDISWWVFDYPNKTKKFAVPERELSLIENT